MIYLDSSALLRLLDDAHPSHRPVLDYLDDGDRWRRLVTSTLTRIEAARVAVRAGNPAIRAAADEFLSAITLIPITAEVTEGARNIAFPVKSLDAIHLSTAAEVRATELLGYDRRMQQVWAEEFGGTPASP